MLKTVTIGSYHYPIRGLVAMVAGTMMLVSISIMMSFANLNTYIISYMRVNDPTLTYADFIFISQGRTLVSGTRTLSMNRWFP
jgi:hypothetical protein